MKSGFNGWQSFTTVVYLALTIDLLPRTKTNHGGIFKIMLRNGRRYVLAAFGLAFFSASPAQGEAQREQPKTNGRATQSAPLVVQPLVNSIELVQPTHSERPCREGESDTHCELRAQWKAADAAQEAADWAERAFWLGALGTIGLFLTLYYTRQAVRAAQDATKDADAALAIAKRNADAAAQQVAVAQDTAKRQLRAYLGLLPAEMSEVAPHCGPVKITITIENSGPTPANDWRIGFAWQVTDEEPTAELFEKLLSPHRNYEGEHSFAPKTTKKMDWDVDISPTNIQLVSEGKMKLFYMGEITYVDIFGDKHKIEFFYVYTTRLTNRLGQAPVKNRIG